MTEAARWRRGDDACHFDDDGTQSSGHRHRQSDRHRHLFGGAPVRARGHGAGRRAPCRCVAERATALKARVLHARAWNCYHRDGVDDVDGRSARPHFLSTETRVCHVTPRFVNMTWGRRCRVCPQGVTPLTEIDSTSFEWTRSVSQSIPNVDHSVDLLSTTLAPRHTMHTCGKRRA